MESLFIAQLTDLPGLLEQRQTLEEGLQDLAASAARSLGAQRCSVMLLSATDDGDPVQLRVCSHFGNLPAEAYEAPVDLESSIAGRVVRTHQALLINDVDHSEVSALARQGPGGGASLMCAPIDVAGQLIGVINVSQPVEPRPFAQEDLDLLKVYSAFVGQSIHVFQLQKLSESRLLQMSKLLDERENGLGGGAISPDPAKLAKLVAKNFYRELAIAGFGPKAIIAVATEVLGLLNENLEKHRSRLGQKTP